MNCCLKFLYKVSTEKKLFTSKINNNQVSAFHNKDNN